MKKFAPFCLFVILLLPAFPAIAQSDPGMQQFVAGMGPGLQVAVANYQDSFEQPKKLGPGLLTSTPRNVDGDPLVVEEQQDRDY